LISSGKKNSLVMPPDLNEQCFDMGSLNFIILNYWQKWVFN